MGIQKLARYRKHILKASLIPFAVVSSTFITGFSSRAYAAVGELKVGVDRSHTSSPVESISETVEKFGDLVTNLTDWYHGLPQDIARVSVDLMSWLYDLSATLILKTPLWLFNNEWFENTTYLFSLVAIGAVSVLTAFEGIKRMVMVCRKRGVKPTDMRQVVKRWFVVAGMMTGIPFLFQKAFQGLNAISDFLIDTNANTMKAVEGYNRIGFLDVSTLVVFDIMLISTIIPLLWKNGRRFFDLMVLGVISPLALTAWIFDSSRSYFHQWWNNLKHLSLVQVYYALFLLILGWFIFGVPTPTQFTGLVVKLLIVIGGFARMNNPPRLIAGHLDRGGGFDDVYKQGGISQMRRNFKDTARVLAHPSSIFKVAYDRMKTPERTGSTRMERMHGMVKKATPKKRK
jgi:hypothetical protein